MATLRFIALTAAAILPIVVGCSSGTVPIGQTDQQDLKAKKGGCTVGSEHHAVGTSFPSEDGCNQCSCDKDGRVLCTTRACSDPAAGACVQNGKSYAVGEQVPSADCNTCTCMSAGQVACTTRACACPSEKVIDCMPIVPPERQSLCSGPYHDWIAQNCPGVTFAL